MLVDEVSHLPMFCSANNNDFQPTDLPQCLSFKSACLPAPYSDDLISMQIRDQCDYSWKITKDVASCGNAPRPVRIYTDGVFDLFHEGHARQLMQAKNIFPNVYLIVGVHSDKTTHENKGNIIMLEDERYELVSHCKYVDEVIRDPPWVTDTGFLFKNKIDFVVHDDLPYTVDDTEDIYKELKSKGMFISPDHIEGVSTSDIVSRIIQDYDSYVHHNIDKGHSAKDMDTSFLTETKIQFQNKMEEFKGRFENKRSKISLMWEEKSRDFISSFRDMFGRGAN